MTTSPSLRKARTSKSSELRAGGAAARVSRVCKILPKQPPPLLPATSDGRNVSPTFRPNRTRMTAHGRLLIIDDHPERANALASQLSAAGYAVDVVSDVRNSNFALGADSELDVATWCRANGLDDLAKQHAQRAIAIDPEHVKAHELLGHVKVGSTWVDRPSRKDEPRSKERPSS